MLPVRRLLGTVLSIAALAVDPTRLASDGFREPLSPTTFGSNFQFTTLPEPSTWILLVLSEGLLAKACSRRPASGQGRRTRRPADDARSA